jgi:hypothetical protein
MSALERASFASLFALAGGTEVRVVCSFGVRCRGTFSLPGGARMRWGAAYCPLGGLDGTKTRGRS